jgi:hypothetical protein
MAACENGCSCDAHNVTISFSFEEPSILQSDTCEAMPSPIVAPASTNGLSFVDETSVTAATLAFVVSKFHPNGTWQCNLFFGLFSRVVKYKS